MTRESTPTRSRQRLAELRRRGTEDHRGHPGSAGDREDPCALGLSAGARGGPGLGALSPDLVEQGFRRLRKRNAPTEVTSRL